MRMKPISTISRLLLAGMVLWVGVGWAQPNVPTMDEEPEFTPGLSNTVSWSDESASGAVEYFVGASEDSLFPDPQQLDLSSGWITDTEHEFDEVLEDGVLYYYRVKSRDADQVMSEWSELVFSTQDASGPDPVTDLDAVGRPTYIRLNWSAVEDAGIGTNNYRVYRSETAGELGNRIITVEDPFYADETVQPQMTYWYTVRPVDEFGNETLEGNNQDDAEIQWLEDPDLMIMEPSDGCYVTELDAVDITGIFSNTLAIWVNDIPARMTLDPVAGEFFAEGVPVEMGPNPMIAYGEGSFDRSDADTITVVRLAEGSGDPVVTFAVPEDGSYYELGSVIDIMGDVENVGCLTVMGEPVDIDWSPDYSTGTFAYPGFELTELGEVTISAEGLGSPAAGETEDRVATAEVTVYVVAPPPLAVEITSPEDGDVTAEETMTVAGTFSGAWKVEVNGLLAELDEGTLTFAVTDLPLEVGPNEIRAVAFGEDDATVEDIITVYRTQEPEPNTPTIEITYPPDDFITNLAVLEVTGTSSYAGYVTVSYEGGDEVMADLTYDTGNWTAQIDLPDPPVSVEIVATAYGVDENAEDSVVIIVIAPDGPPSIEITFPPDGYTTNATSVTVEGTAENVGRVFVNDVEAAFDDFTNFELETELVQGWNTIIAVGYGVDDQTAADTVQVYSDQDCEGDPGEVTITDPVDGYMTGEAMINVAGTSNCIVSVDVNGVDATLDLASGDWSADGIALEWGENTVTATGINYDGGEATASITVYRLQPPTIAITSPEDGAEFVYEDSMITVNGTSTGLLSVFVNDVEATLETSTGEWSLSGVHLDVGPNTITAVGEGLQQVSASITVEREPFGEPIEYHGIFTPNGDNYNDEANLPCDDQNSTGAIYTRDGQEVVGDLGQPVRSRDNRWYLQWDGRDNEDVVVPSGVYIYQVDNDGDKTTGTIVVAR